MQRTKIIKGAVSKDYGTTITENINTVLKNSPDWSLNMVKVLKVNDCFCTALCVFEKADDSRNLDSTEKAAAVD